MRFKISFIKRVKIILNSRLRYDTMQLIYNLIVSFFLLLKSNFRCALKLILYEIGSIILKFKLFNRFF